MLKLFNTLTNGIEELKPIKDGHIGLYSCGPTAYNFAHLGNWRAYIFVDLLKRYLKYSGFDVKHVMNITDVDDKTIRESQKEGKKLEEFTEFYTDAFLEDMKALNIEKPDVLPKATEHIGDMVTLIKKLKEKGYTYESDGSIYFRISKFKNYGQLARLDEQGLKQNAGGRLSTADEYDKENVNDFVLWKAWKPEDGSVFWETELGKGRPGWHVECSAMSMKYLGETFGIHTGGVDLIFPHHTNEIAQSEGATGKKFVNYWLHNAHLTVESKKMSKSLGNFYTLRDLQKKKCNNLLTRLVLLKTHYRKILDFTFEDYQEAEAEAGKFLDLLINLESAPSKTGSGSIKSAIDGNREKFKAALNDDLNISLAFTHLFDFINEVNKNMPKIGKREAEEIKTYIIEEVDSVLGFIAPLYEQYKKRLQKITKRGKIQELLKKRNKARENKDYKTADGLRAELLEAGIIVNDTKDGCHLRLADLFEA